MAEKVDVNKALDINKDGFSNGGIDIETPGQNLVRDPRTKTLAAGTVPAAVIIIGTAFSNSATQSTTALYPAKLD